MKLLCSLVLLVVGTWTSAISQAPTLLNFTPDGQQIDVIRNADITAQFDVPIMASSVDSFSFRVFGRWSGAIPGTISFEAAGSRIRFSPTSDFFAGDWITVALSKGIRGTNNVPLDQSYSWNFWAKADPASLDLDSTATINVRQQSEGAIISYGAYAGDLNHDGYSDMAVVNEGSNDFRVFLNDGSGGYSNFTVFSLPGGDFPSPSEGADFNSDGHIDIALGNTRNDKVSVFMGDGTGGFAPEVTYDADDAIRGIGIVDADGDGFTDIVTANRDGSNASVLLNAGNGTFGAPTNLNANGLGETAIAVADANEDGIMDLFVGSFQNNVVEVFLGNGNGGYSISGNATVGGSIWQIVAGDFDGDGHVDVATANSQDNSMSVAFGDGTGSLSGVQSYSTGNFSFSIAIDAGDIDGDGDLDLVVSNFSTADYRLFENDGSGNFGNVRIYPAAAAGSCVVLHDRDNDGDLDMSAIDEMQDVLILFTNNGLVTAPAPLTVSEMAVTAFPNPARDEVTIRASLPQPRRLSLRILDLRGRVIHAATLPKARQHAYAWRPDKLPAGFYTASLKAGASIRHLRLIIKY